MRMLKVPTMADRAWQCLAKYALEPAHEATFHARSYGFRPGRATHDAQKILFINLQSNKHGIDKRVIELDIEKCARPEMVKGSVEPTPLSDLHHSPSSKTTLWVGLNT